MADINVKMGVTGVAQFRTNIKNAQSAVKALDAEMKLAEANYKATGDAQEYAAKKTEILQKQIEEQKKIVDETKRAMEQLAAGGIDKSSAAYQQWAGKLASAQATLVSMQSSLKSNTQGIGQQEKALESAGKEAGDYKDHLASIDKQVTFDTVIGGINKVTDVVEKAARRVAALAKSLWDMEADASTWADDLITQAAQYGITTTELQQMKYASRFIDTETDVILKARDRLMRAAEAPDENGMMEIFEGFTTSAISKSGGMKSAETLLWETVDAINALETEQEKINAAQEVFGRSYRELGTLFQPGAKADWYEAMAEAPVVSEENVQALGQANDALQRLEAEYQKLKMDVAGELAGGFERIADALTTATEKINEFTNSPEGQAALNGLAESTAGLVESFANPETLKSAIGTVTEAVKGLTGGLEWFKNNSETVSNALKGIAEGFVALKIASAGLEIAKIVSTLAGYFGSRGTTETAANAAGAAAGAAAAAEAAKDAAGGLPKWMNLLSKAALTKTAAGIADYMPGGSKYTVRFPDGTETLASEIKTIPITKEQLAEMQAEKSPKQNRPMTLNVPDWVDTSQIKMTVPIDLEETEKQAKEDMEELKEMMQEASEGIGKAGGTALTSSYATWIDGTMGAMGDALQRMYDMIMGTVNAGIESIARLQAAASGGAVLRKNYNATTNLNVQNMNLSTRYDADTLLTMLTDQQRRAIQGVGGP